MTARDLLAQVTDLGVELTLEGDNIRYQAPKGVLTPDIRAALRQSKPQLIQLLSKSRTTRVAAISWPEECLVSCLVNSGR